MNNLLDLLEQECSDSYFRQFNFGFTSYAETTSLDVISCAFSWADSEEGPSFWDAIWKSTDAIIATTSELKEFVTLIQSLPSSQRTSSYVLNNYPELFI